MGAATSTTTPSQRIVSQPRTSGMSSLASIRYAPLCRAEAQGQNFKWPQRYLQPVAVHDELLLVFFEQVCAPGFGQGETGLEHHGSALALALVEADDVAVAVFGPLDRFDDHIRPVGLDEGGRLGGRRSGAAPGDQ